MLLPCLLPLLCICSAMYQLQNLFMLMLCATWVARVCLGYVSGHPKQLCRGVFRVPHF